jgi:hypothetical protein
MNTATHCHQCGFPVEEDCDFCPNCGTRGQQQNLARNSNYQTSLPVQYIPPPPPSYPQQYTPQAMAPAHGYAFQPIERRQINTGLCVLMSFLWTGAGFFFIPDRVPIGLVLVLCTAAIGLFIIFGAGLTGGVGACCTLPIGFVWWFGILTWTYKDAERYNRGA